MRFGKLENQLRALAILTLMLVGGCAETSDYEQQHRADEERHARLNPAGRYEMLPVPDEKAVFVLDTGDGSIRKCNPLPDEARGDFAPMGCGPAATQ